MKMYYTIIVLVIVSLASCGTVPKLRPAEPYIGALRASSIENQIHRLVNMERKDKNLSPLGLDKDLSRIARAHSSDMTKRGYFSHFSPDGKDFSHRYDKGGYDCSVTRGQTIYLGAENIFNIIFTGTQSEKQIASDTVKGWMESPGHRRNILTSHWGQEGIGVSIGRDGQMIIIYITQNFC
jgi:uncharacterized protein YkwD